MNKIFILFSLFINFFNLQNILTQEAIEIGVESVDLNTKIPFLILLPDEKDEWLKDITKISNFKGSYKSAIVTCDINGNNKKTILETPTINVKPVWNNNKINPKLLYSEFTNSNVRLMSIDSNLHRRPVFDFDGTIVGI